MASRDGLLFEPALPPGLSYRDGFVSEEEASALAAAIEAVRFEEFTMRGVVARRRVAFFGHSYQIEHQTVSTMPDFLLPLRERLAEWAGVSAADFAMALINEYRSGAPIGWHRDAPQYGIVAGVSLLSACVMRFRPYLPPAAARGGGRRVATHELALAPRSAYLMTGAARQDFEHSIPPATTLRYSITFRTLRHHSG